jgi:hypothetical protein
MAPINDHDDEAARFRKKIIKAASTGNEFAISQLVEQSLSKKAGVVSPERAAEFYAEGARVAKHCGFPKTAAWLRTFEP